MSTTFIGRSIDNNTAVEIGDIERRSGLYILGNPGMGKSNLMELMILSDIQKGSGVFFLDPHGEAIDRIIKYVKTGNTHSIRILDPEDEKYSFGINPLACRDLASLKERTDTYTRAYNIFYKLWKNILDERPWLQLIVQNTLYALMENPDYTLSEMALFLTDENFMYHLANNIKYNLDVKDFWLKRFAGKRNIDKERQADAALTRINTLLGQPHIRHIIGQRRTTIDFPKVLAEQEPIFFKLSASLAPDIKKFIGTIIISELLQAVRNRPSDKRDQFCVYIDEFQNFASSEDLATFITEARKFGIATTIAHQERFGQLGDYKKMLGATLTAANKVFFQLNIKDAEEQAGEFAREPPTETRLERQFTISQEPLFDLIHGHDNPEVRAFVTKYLRPLKERREDVAEAMEERRLWRMMYLDVAGMHGLDEQRERLETRNYHAQLEHLGGKGHGLALAQYEGMRLFRLFDESHHLRLTQRALNNFFVEIMEGRVAQGQEAFSEFLISFTNHISVIPKNYVNALRLYIALTYGDANTARAIPFEFSKKINLFPAEVALLTDQTTQKTRKERLAFEEKYQKEKWESFHDSLEDERYRRARRKNVRHILVERTLRSGQYISKYEGDSDLSSKRVYQQFLWLESDTSLQNTLAPYYNARFTEEWKQHMWYEDCQYEIDRINQKFVSKPGYSYPSLLIKNAKRLKAFLEKYGEGALVVFALLNAPRHNNPEADDYYYQLIRADSVIEWWNKEDQDYCFAKELKENSRELRMVSYLNLSMVDFPAIEGIEPLQVVRLVKKINHFQMNTDKREDVREWKELFEKRWGHFAWERPAAARIWNSGDALLREYLFTRACDLVQFGEDIADMTFPLPANSDYSWVVSSLVWLFDEYTNQLIKKMDDDQEAQAREKITRECAVEAGKIVCYPPETLSLRVLEANDIHRVRTACISELQQAGEPVRSVVTTIDELAAFCTLLAKPENLIKVPTGQYIEKQVYTRSALDMKIDMVKELARLSPYVAWTKTFDVHRGVLMKKIGTVNVSDYYEYNEDYLRSLWMILERSRSLYLVRRDLIEKEIIERQAKWMASVSILSVRKTADRKETGKGRPGGSDKPPPASSPVYGHTQKPAAPPPASFSNQPPAATQEPVKPKTVDNSKEPGETGLIYRSDFYSSSDHWFEGENDGIKRFCQEGYYHILLVNPYWWAYSMLTNINLTDFRVYVEAEIIMHTGDNAGCGIVFRRTKTDDDYLFYYLAVLRSGYYNICIKDSKNWREILKNRFSEFIHQGDRVNSLMVEARGQKITVGVNGHILETVMDNNLASGSIGFWMQTEIDSTAEVRFRNFRLYSLE